MSLDQGVPSGCGGWEAKYKAFWAVENQYVTLRGKEVAGEDFDGDALARAETDLRAASSDVVRQITHDPDALRDKNKMYGALMNAAAYFNDDWLENIAEAILASAGEMPPGCKASDSGIVPPATLVWKPAIQFWHRYAEGKPTSDEGRLVVESSPTTKAELADKLKIIAFHGVLTALKQAVTFETNQLSVLDNLIMLANRVLASTTEECVAVFENRRPFKKIVNEASANSKPPTNTECCLLGLRLVPSVCRDALRRESDRVLNSVF